MYLTQHTNRLTHLEFAVSTAASSSSIRFCICLFSPCVTANASRHLFASCLCCCTLKYLCCKTLCSLRCSICIFASLIFACSARCFAFITRRARCVIVLYVPPLHSKSQPAIFQASFAFVLRSSKLKNNSDGVKEFFFCIFMVCVTSRACFSTFCCWLVGWLVVYLLIV